MSAPVSSADSARSLQTIFQRVSPQMAALDVFMREQVLGFEAEIREMAAYCLETSGKRLRPVLVFASGWTRDGEVNETLVRVAGVIEMVHLATLVHDDIMDEAELRRNRRTAAREYGPHAAVLLGDALFSQALHVASNFPTPEICREVSASTRRVCSGEIMQTLRRRDLRVSLAEYYRMIDLKTAELFRVACRLGAQFGGYSQAYVEAADTFGHHLGIAYQIYDDLVDFFGEENRIGKTLGTDLATGKLTLPLMLLLERLAGDEREALVTALRGGEPAALSASAARMREFAVVEEVISAIEKELETASSALAVHAELPPVALLGSLADVLRQQVNALQAPTRHRK